MQSGQLFSFYEVIVLYLYMFCKSIFLINVAERKKFQRKANNSWDRMNYIYITNLK